MKLVTEQRVVSAPKAAIKIIEVTIPTSVQMKIAKGLELGPPAIAAMYPPPPAKPKKP